MKSSEEYFASRNLCIKTTNEVGSKKRSQLAVRFFPGYLPDNDIHDP